MTVEIAKKHLASYLLKFASRQVELVNMIQFSFLHVLLQ